MAREQFERYLATEPTEATVIREQRQVFHAFVLDGVARELLSTGDFGGVRARDASLYQCVRALGPERLQTLLDYLRSQVALDQFVVVA